MKGLNGRGVWNPIPTRDVGWTTSSCSPGHLPVQPPGSYAPAFNAYTCDFYQLQKAIQKLLSVEAWLSTAWNKIGWNAFINFSPNAKSPLADDSAQVKATLLQLWNSMQFPSPIRWIIASKNSPRPTEKRWFHRARTRFYTLNVKSKNEPHAYANCKAGAVENLLFFERNKKRREAFLQF